MCNRIFSALVPPRMAVALAVALVLAHSARADVLVGPLGDPALVPPPGSVTDTFVGDGTSAGGATFGASGFQFGPQLSHVFWGLSTVYGINAEMDRNYGNGRDPGGPFTDTGEKMSFAGIGASAGLNPNQARWSGQTAWPHLDSGNTVVSDVETRFTLTATDTVGNAINLIDPISVGIGGIEGAALDISSGGFKANWIFEVRSPFDSQWAPLRDVFNSANAATGQHGQVQFATSFGGATYYTRVPEPSSILLLVMGLAGVGIRVVRRRHK